MTRPDTLKPYLDSSDIGLLYSALIRVCRLQDIHPESAEGRAIARELVGLLEDAVDEDALVRLLTTNRPGDYAKAA